MTKTPAELIALLKETFNQGIHNYRIIKKTDGVKNPQTQNIMWVTVDRRIFHRTVTLLNKIFPLHIACPMASREHSDGLELIYTFTLFSGEGNFGEIIVNIIVFLPENDLRIRSVSDVLPGILYMERETMEMLGVTVEDIPDQNRLFTPDSMPQDYYPLRSKFNG